MVEKELTPYLKETRYAHLIKCFLDPNDMIRGAEVPNSLRDDELAYEEGPNGDIQPAMRGGSYRIYCMSSLFPHQSSKVSHSAVNALLVTLMTTCIF